MARPVAVLELTDEERQRLEQRVRSPTTSQRDSLRARIVLLHADDCFLRDTARRLGASVPCVLKRSRRCDTEGLDGLRDKPGRGAKPSMPESTVQRIIAMAGQAPPGCRRWSTGTAAVAAGVSSDTVSRIRRSQGLQPHRARTCNVSADKRFEEKFRDVIGLYPDPPERALALCCDEKALCQALERTQPCLPLGVGHVRTRTRDCIRHGTVALFAALNYLDGKLIHRTEAKHAHVEWLRFPKRIEPEAPRDIDIHPIADNRSTHKHARVQAWLEKRTCFHMHFVPASSSWMNLVERFFADLAEECVRADSFASVAQLTAAITACLAERNANPKPYRWKAEGKDILAKIQRARKALDEQRARIAASQCES